MGAVPLRPPARPAREIAHDFLWSFCHRDRLLGEHHQMCDRLTAAIEADRAATIEACAEVAETVERYSLGRLIGERIRALASTATGTAGG